MTTTRGRHSQADAEIGVPSLRRRVRELAEQAEAAASGIAVGICVPRLYLQAVFKRFVPFDRSKISPIVLSRRSGAAAKADLSRHAR